MKYKIGDVVMLKQGRRGDFYHSFNRPAIITETYNDVTYVKGYRVIVAGEPGSYYFALDKDIEKKIEAQ